MIETLLCGQQDAEADRSRGALGVRRSPHSHRNDAINE